MTAGVGPAPAVSGSGGLQRYRAVISYDGSRYHGWARQPRLASVEQAVLDALERVLRVAPERLTCAGRTDAGVHAWGQVVHFDVPIGADAGHLLRGVNAVLPPDVRFRSVTAAPSEFDARFAALWRHYRFRLTDGIADPLTRHMVLAVRPRLDVDAMDAAVQHLIGPHDFGSFCKPREGATTIRAVLWCRWRRQGSDLGVLDIRADAFCHSMVRSVVGASIDVGAGRRSPEWFAGLLATPSRAASAPVAPAHGLVLQEVGYPPDDQLADRVAMTRRVRGAG